MYATVNVGIIRRVVPLQGFDDRLRLLRGCRVVEIYQRITVDMLVQDGKIRADACDVVSTQSI